MSTLPVAELYQAMSLVPSPLNSPTPAGVHPSGCEPTSTLPFQWPFRICQMSTFPVAGLYQAMSSVPSPLKSPMPAGVHPAGCEPTSKLGAPVAIHDLPDVDVARCRIVPGDVVGAVVIEVADADRRPSGRV